MQSISVWQNDMAKKGANKINYIWYSSTLAKHIKFRTLNVEHWYLHSAHIHSTVWLRSWCTCSSLVTINENNVIFCSLNEINVHGFSSFLRIERERKNSDHHIIKMKNLRKINKRVQNIESTNKKNLEHKKILTPHVFGIHFSNLCVLFVLSDAINWV